MKTYIKKYTTAFSLTSALVGGGVGLTTASVAEPYAFEKEITFEARGKKPVAAYEGTIQVPENRKTKSGRLIELKYIRFPAVSDKKGPPIVYLAGGPGGSGIRTAKYRRFDMFMALRQYGDVIALDQRGVGVSGKLPYCSSDQKIPQQEIISEAEFIKRNQDAFEYCVAYWKDKGVDVGAYNTVENAWDVDTIRQKLGADKVVLWGTSYGSHLALAALKEFEDKIAKVILSSAEGLDQTIKRPMETDAYFDRIQAAIDIQRQAKAMFPDIKGLMKRVHEKLDQKPIKLSLKMRDGTLQDYILYRHEMQRMASAMIADPHRVVGLMHIYLALDHGVTAPLEGMLGRFIKPQDPIGFSAMSSLMDVASGMTAQKAQMIRSEAKSSLLKDYLNFSYHFDGLVPELDLGDDFRAKPQSDVPMLLVTGTLDGRTYTNSQTEAVSGMKNLTQVMVVNGGHNVFMSSPEVQQAINEFMDGKPVSKKQITIDLPDFSNPR